MRRIIRANSGSAQSTARDFRVSTVINGNKQEALIIGVSKTFTVRLNSGGKPQQSVIFREDQILYNRTSSPIPVGGTVYGVLLCMFSLNDALFRTAEVRLSFHDAFGGEETASLVGKGQSRPVLNIPTISLETSSP
jgi:hypothetical protein